MRLSEPSLIATKEAGGRCRIGRDRHGPDALSELVNADRPRVFYCGFDKLLETIQKCVKAGQAERKRELEKSSTAHPSPKITDCVYYKESCEMKI